MSSESIITVEIRCLAMLIKSMADLCVKYKELSKMKTADGKIETVDLVLKDENGKDIGFKKEKDGNYVVVSDTSGLNAAQIRKQQEFIKKIRQRYTYNKVIDDLKKQGYVVAEEEKVKNNTIRLVARKW